MKVDETLPTWNEITDTPDEFRKALEEARTPNEKEFFEQLLYKEHHEPAAMYEVLMHDRDNEECIYILRDGYDEYTIGFTSDEKGPDKQSEWGGLFFFLEQDMWPYIGRHISVLEWLRERDFRGICYDRNNDLQ